MDAATTTPENLGPERRAAAELAHRFHAEQVQPHVAALERLDLATLRSLLERAGTLGLLAVEVPESLGGSGADFVTNLVVTERLARYASFGVAYSVQSGLALWPIAYLGSAAQKSRLLPQLAQARSIASFAVTEPGAGSDVGALQTRAVSDGTGSYRLTGQKAWISNAGMADLFVTLARLDAHQYAFFVVERERPGVSLGPEEEKMGLRGSSTRRVHLDDVPLSRDAMLGDPRDGLAGFRRMINLGRTKVGAASVGLCKEALQLAVTHARTRRQFGRSLAGFGVIQAKLGRMLSATFAAESLVYRTAGMVQRQIGGELHPAAVRHLEDLTFEVSALKVFATEALSEVADEAVQIHGGHGFSSGFPGERLYRDARVFRIFEGTNELNRLIACDAMTSGRRRSRGEREEPSEDTVQLRDFLPLRSVVCELISEARQRKLLGADAPQELQHGLGDFAIRLFAVESALLRIELGRRGGVFDSSLAAALRDVLIEDAWSATGQASRELVPWLGDGSETDRLWRRLAGDRLPPPGAAARSRRRLAEAVLAEGTWPESFACLGAGTPFALERNITRGGSS